MLNYKNHLDGLRGLAVLAVFFFHLGYLQGGFIGVDVFFTLSGYLITGKIYQIKNKRDFFTFIIKRFKRLCPSIFVVSSSSVLLGYLLFPIESQNLLNSFVSIFFNYYNFFLFFNSLDYFNNLETLNFLTHFWTLSVEIQFYLITLLLFTLFKNKTLYFFLIISFVVSLFLSFDLSVIKSFYYSTPIRYYEFLIGSFCYLTINKKFLEIDKHISVISLLLLGACTFIFSNNLIFPYLYALVPCLATFFLIRSKNKNLNEILSISYLRFIGKLSYSIYLVHYPVIIFLSYHFRNHFIIFFVSTFLTGILSYALYAFVEKKTRHASINSFFYKYTSPLLLLIPIILITSLESGYFKLKNNELINQLNNEKELRSKFNYAEKNKISESKYSNNSKKDKTILIVGDSHADNIMMIFDKYSYNYQGIKVIKIQIDTICTNPHHKQRILGYLIYGKDHKGTCKKQIENLKKQIKINDVQLFILSNNWKQDNINYFPKYLSNYFSDKNILIVNQIVRFDNFYKNTFLSNKEEINSDLFESIDQVSLKISKKIKIYANSKNIKIFDPNKYLCNFKKFSCSVFSKDLNKFIFLDGGGHLSYEGIKLIEENFFKTINIMN